MNSHRIGLVGAGGIAHRHIDGYREVLGVRADVTAVCDLRQDVMQAFADQYGIEHRFTDPEAMMASGEIEVAVDLTPPMSRDAVIEPALNHGIHLLVEKPFGRDARRAVEYVRAAADAGTTLAVNQNFRWFPEIREARTLLDGGDLGPIRFVEHQHFQHRTLERGAWRAAEERLEMAIFGIHIIDRVQWLVGVDPRAVSAVTFRDPHDDLPGERFASMLIQFDGGIVGQVTSSWVSKSLPESRLRIDADLGSIAAHRRSGLWGDMTFAVALQGEDERIRHHRDTGDFNRSFGHSMAALLDGLDAGQEPVNSGCDNLKTMGIMDAAYLSAHRDGELVTVDEALGVTLSTVQVEGRHG